MANTPERIGPDRQVFPDLWITQAFASAITKKVLACTESPLYRPVKIVLSYPVEAAAVLEPEKGEDVRFLVCESWGKCTTIENCSRRLWGKALNGELC